MRKGFWPRFWFTFLVFAFKVGLGGSFVRSRDPVSTPPWPNLGSGASVFHFFYLSHEIRFLARVYLIFMFAGGIHEGFRSFKIKFRRKCVSRLYASSILSLSIYFIFVNTFKFIQILKKSLDNLMC